MIREQIIDTIWMLLRGANAVGDLTDDDMYSCTQFLGDMDSLLDMFQENQDKHGNMLRLDLDDYRALSAIVEEYKE